MSEPRKRKPKVFHLDDFDETPTGPEAAAAGLSAVATTRGADDERGASAPVHFAASASSPETVEPEAGGAEALFQRTSQKPDISAGPSEPAAKMQKTSAKNIPHVIDLSEELASPDLRETPFPDERSGEAPDRRKMKLEEREMDPVTGHSRIHPDEVDAPIIPTFQEIRDGWRWKTIFVAAILGLISMTITAMITDYVMRLMNGQGLLGMIMLGLLAVALLALVMISMKEYLALRKLKCMAALRKKADLVFEANKREGATEVVQDLCALLGERKELNWNRDRMKAHMQDVLDGREILTLAERELIAPLDPKAHEIIASTARRVSVVTTVSPFALIDMGFVAFQNMKMLRQLSLLYGGKPGMLSVFRLIRMIIGHLAVTGGVAIADDVLKQILSHSVAAKLSAKLGQGLLNGALTARIGVAAMGTVRPLPHIETKPANFKVIAAEALNLRKL